MEHTRWARLLAGIGAATAIALLPAGPRLARAAPAAIIVNDSGDTTPCPVSLTLRCAIEYANANPFTTINFAPNILAVVLNGALPFITGNGTWIDGTTVVPRIDGAFWSGAAGSAFQIQADNVTISNLTVVNIPPGAADIRIQSGKNTKIVYNNLGIRPGATQCGTDTSYGVLLDSNISGAAGNNNGVAYIFGNTISCHGSYGVWDYFANYVGVGVDGVGNTIGNKIGTTSDGAHAAGNFAGIEVDGDTASNLTIRGNLVAYNAGAGIHMAFGASHNNVVFNVITSNGGPGIRIDSGSADQIIGNDIGTNAGGVAVQPNGQEGIRLAGGTGLFLSDNIIAYNGLQGIGVIGSTTQAAIQNNEIRNNGGLPIDLGEDGPTLNGAHLPPGPNSWLGYPVLSSASSNSIFGITCPNCHVFIYRAIGNPAAPGGGGTYLTNVLANGSGQWFAILPVGMTRWDVTFTALDSNGNSSEMSPRPILYLPLIQR